MTAFLVMTGCETFTESGPAQEQAPAYEGQSGDADGDGEISPLEAHLMARRMVNPTGDSSRYTYQAGQPHDNYYQDLKNLSGRDPRTPESARALRDESREGVDPPIPPSKPRFAKSPYIDGRPFERDVTIDAAPMPGRKPEILALAPEDEAMPDNEIAPVAGVVPEPPRRAASGSAAVTGMRLGEHPGRTRVVLDLSAPSGYGVNVDNASRVLRIELPQAGWDAPAQKTFGNHAFFNGYTTRAGASGTVLEISLKRNSKVLTSVALPPNEIHGHRIYFDIGPG